jgi:hypothetical protein
MPNIFTGDVFLWGLPICNFSSNLNPHKHNIWTANVHLFTFLNIFPLLHSNIIRQKTQVHKWKSMLWKRLPQHNFPFMYLRFLPEDGRVERLKRCRKVDKWTYGIQILCLCGFKLLLTSTTEWCYLKRCNFFTHLSYNPSLLNFNLLNPEIFLIASHENMKKW